MKYYFLLLFLFIVCISIPLFLKSREGAQSTPYNGPPESELARIDDEFSVVKNDLYVENTIDYTKLLNSYVPMMDDIWRYAELARNHKLSNWNEVIKKHGRIQNISISRIPYIREWVIHYRYKSDKKTYDTPKTIEEIAYSLNRMNNRIEAVIRPLREKMDDINSRDNPPNLVAMPGLVSIIDYCMGVKNDPNPDAPNKEYCQQNTGTFQSELDTLLKKKEEYEKTIIPDKPKGPKLPKDTKDKEAYEPRLKEWNKLLSPIQEAVDKGLIKLIDYEPILDSNNFKNKEITMWPLYDSIDIFTNMVNRYDASLQLKKEADGTLNGIVNLSDYEECKNKMTIVDEKLNKMNSYIESSVKEIEKIYFGKTIYEWAEINFANQNVRQGEFSNKDYVKQAIANANVYLDLIKKDVSDISVKKKPIDDKIYELRMIIQNKALSEKIILLKDMILFDGSKFINNRNIGYLPSINNLNESPRVQLQQSLINTLDASILKIIDVCVKGNNEKNNIKSYYDNIIKAKNSTEVKTISLLIDPQLKKLYDYSELVVQEKVTTIKSLPNPPSAPDDDNFKNQSSEINNWINFYATYLTLIKYIEDFTNLTKKSFESAKTLSDSISISNTITRLEKEEADRIKKAVSDAQAAAADAASAAKNAKSYYLETINVSSIPEKKRLSNLTIDEANKAKSAYDSTISHTTIAKETALHISNLQNRYVATLGALTAQQQAYASTQSAYTDAINAEENAFTAEQEEQEENVRLAELAEKAAKIEEEAQVAEAERVAQAAEAARVEQVAKVAAVAEAARVAEVAKVAAVAEAAEAADAARAAEQEKETSAKNAAKAAEAALAEGAAEAERTLRAAEAVTAANAARAAQVARTAAADAAKAADDAIAEDSSWQSQLAKAKNDTENQSILSSDTTTSLDETPYNSQDPSPYSPEISSSPYSTAPDEDENSDWKSSLEKIAKIAKDAENQSILSSETTDNSQDPSPYSKESSLSLYSSAQEPDSNPLQNSAAKPVVQNFAAKPVVQNSAAKPVVQNSAAKPVVQNSAAKPVVQNSAAKPVVQNSAAKPVVQNSAPKPVVQNSAAKPVVQNSAARPVANTVQNAAARPVANTVVNSVPKPAANSVPEPASVMNSGLKFSLYGPPENIKSTPEKRNVNIQSNVQNKGTISNIFYNGHEKYFNDKPK